MEALAQQWESLWIHDDDDNIWSHDKDLRLVQLSNPKRFEIQIVDNTKHVQESSRIQFLLVASEHNNNYCLTIFLWKKFAFPGLILEKFKLG